MHKKCLSFRFLPLFTLSILAYSFSPVWAWDTSGGSLNSAFTMNPGNSASGWRSAGTSLSNTAGGNQTAESEYYTSQNGYAVSVSLMADAGYMYTVYDSSGGTIGNTLLETFDLDKACDKAVAVFNGKLSSAASYNPLVKTNKELIKNADELASYEYAYFTLKSDGKTDSEISKLGSDEINTYTSEAKMIAESLKNNGQEATLNNFEAINVMRYSALSQELRNSAKSCDYKLYSEKIWVISSDKSQAVNMNAGTLAELRNAGYTDDLIVRMGAEGKGIKTAYGKVSWFENNIKQDPNKITVFHSTTVFIRGYQMKTAIPGSRKNQFFTFDSKNNIVTSNDFTEIRKIAEIVNSSVYNSDLLTVAWDNPYSHDNAAPAKYTTSEVKYLDESWFRHNHVVDERGQSVPFEDFREGEYTITTTYE